ncbi:MAG: DegT/DnrJ/EryC1/StrS family aminotransferase [Gammaproteobacteria bacterium]|nr:DegT/DnrJ/EryC1/StrS family aminotransferase [Gammaproteobacteria bacterium]
MLPVLNLRTFLPRRRASYPSRFTGNTSVFVTSGRAALGHVLKQSGVTRDTRVLMPAYHCGSMVEPALWLNSEVMFYKVKPDLTIDSADIEGKLSTNTKAVLVTHYFGFPQPLKRVRELCDLYKIALIEDCAHAFFGRSDGAVFGTTGDFAVASTTKFLPVSDGGLIECKSPLLSRTTLSRRPMKAQLKAVVDPIETAVNFGRLPLLSPFLLCARAIFNKGRLPKTAASVEPEPTKLSYRQPFRWFEPSLIPFKGCWFSHYVLRLSAKERVVANRRKNYLFFLENLCGLERAKPLFPILPEGVVPYTFPLIIDFPEQDFKPLKELRVPIWRWEELAESDCRVSQGYRLSLLQIPCHQDLQKSELVWIVDQLRRILEHRNALS